MSLDGQCLLTLDAFNLHLEFLADPLAFQALLLQLPHQLVPLARKSALDPLELSLQPAALGLHPQHPFLSLRVSLAHAHACLLQASLVVTQLDSLVLDDRVTGTEGVPEVRHLQLEDGASLEVLLLESQVVSRPGGQLLLEEGLRLRPQLGDQHVLVCQVGVTLVADTLEVPPDPLGLLVEGPLGLLQL